MIRDTLRKKVSLLDKDVVLHDREPYFKLLQNTGIKTLFYKPGNIKRVKFLHLWKGKFEVFYCVILSSRLYNITTFLIKFMFVLKQRNKKKINSDTWNILILELGSTFENCGSQSFFIIGEVVGTWK